VHLNVWWFVRSIRNLSILLIFINQLSWNRLIFLQFFWVTVIEILLFCLNQTKCYIINVKFKSKNKYYYQFFIYCWNQKWRELYQYIKQWKMNFFVIDASYRENYSKKHKNTKILMGINALSSFFQLFSIVKINYLWINSKIINLFISTKSVSLQIVISFSFPTDKMKIKIFHHQWEGKANILTKRKLNCYKLKNEYDTLITMLEGNKLVIRKRVSLC
jgi:hypothetical protein